MQASIVTKSLPLYICYTLIRLKIKYKNENDWSDVD